MFKRYSPNYSLWPEHARPRRSNSLKFAAGSFFLGAVCAAAAYGLAFDFGAAPAAAQRREPGQAVQSIPVYTAAIEQPATTTPARVGGEDRGSRTRVTATKTTLPIIGSQTDALPLVPTRGADSEKLAGEAPEADIAKSTGRPTSLARREDRPEQKPQVIEARPDEVKPAATAVRNGKPSKTLVEKTPEAPARPDRAVRDPSEPVRDPVVPETKSVEAKPAAIVERSGKPSKTLVGRTPEEPARPERVARNPSEPVREPVVRETKSVEAKPAAIAERTAKRSKNLVEKKREGSKSSIARNRQEREEPTRYARRQRQDQSSRAMMETALRALRQFTGGQDLLGM